MFRVSTPQFIIDRLRAHADRLTAPEDRRRLASALKEMETGLEADPENWGEPKFHLPNSPVLYCIGVCPPIFVDYGIHAGAKVVFIFNIRILN